MAAVRSEISVTEGVGSLEVRWIVPGELESALARWFGRLPAEVESREDMYLNSPHLPTFSVKVRAGRTLDVKVYRGSAGILAVADRARGRMEFWQKWSFDGGPASLDVGKAPGWRAVHKTRRISRFSQGGSRTVPRHVPRPGEEPGCAVELTTIRTRDGAWWSLGFEATGPADRLRSELEITAALVFAEALPGGVELGADDSRSYADWLRPQPCVTSCVADAFRV